MEPEPTRIVRTLSDAALATEGVSEPLAPILTETVCQRNVQSAHTGGRLLTVGNGYNSLGNR